MPRVSPRDVSLAGRLHPLLPKLMGVCRTIESSRRELRWLEDEILRLDARESFRLLQRYQVPFQPLPTEFVRKVRNGSSSTSLPRGKWEKLLLQKFIEQRSKGMPLSLVVENQPFGHLKIRVRPGVFIPRWETEEWTLALASRLRRLSPSRKNFTVVDLCTGSGCIPLLLKAYVSANLDKSLHPAYGKPNPFAQFIGIEKSATAIDIARLNLKQLQQPDQKFPDSYCSLVFLANQRSIYFLHHDIMDLPTSAFQGRVDIITCNPPYIPIASRPTIDHSVTKFEPSRALFAPSPTGIDYYPHLLDIANRWESSVLIMEVGDLEQAELVKSLIDRDAQWKSSIWLDSADKGRVVVAVKSDKWAFLLPQPDYSIPVDLSAFPKLERPRLGRPGSIISTFQRRKFESREIRPQRVKREKEKAGEDDDTDAKEEPQLGFVDRLLEKLKLNVQEEEGPKTGLIKYLEDLKKISK